MIELSTYHPVRQLQTFIFLFGVMDIYQVIFLSFVFLVTALLYASVGQAGGTGYLAAMAILGLSPQIMKPTALILNILVAAIATYQYCRAGCFSWKLFWPFAITSVPMAFLGGSLTLPGKLYQVIVGAVLIFAAARLAFQKPRISGGELRDLPLPAALGIGAVIGLLSGLTGIGGGIFLAPLLLLLDWSDLAQASGVAALFILVNSLSGLFGNLTSMRFVPYEMPYWLLAVAIGGWVGASYGIRHLNSPALGRILSLIMVFAGVKIIFI